MPEINTNQLKRFAQEARIKIVSQVAAKLEYVLTTDSAVLREKEGQVKKLKAEIHKTSKAKVVDKVAYTWFNRLMALRFMDVNDYQPIKLMVVTPKDGYTLPELLDEAKQGNIPDELPVDTKHIFELLDGTIRSSDAQNEAYKELLIGACNHLNTIFPFLFEKINDYAELLLPDDLTSEFSIVQDIRDGMSTEDCAEVEIIGWIYQFYISERKDEVFAAKGKVKKEDIPAATQLFTPRWIVEYMVQNTVGKLWLQNRPNSSLKDHMPYYIESPSTESDDFLKIDSVEEITLLDQACGSGHILVYGFELLTKIYEEEGYSPSEIPQLIIKKNLYGFEIDERAAQLAGLALMMKAREYHKRVFKKELTPHILCYQDLVLNVYKQNGFNEIFKVKKDSKLLEDVVNYGYCIAENIQDIWEEDFTNKDTGETVTIERTELKIKKGSQVNEKDLADLKRFGNTEISFFKDEIKDTFRLANLELNYFVYLDLTLMLQATNLGSLILPKSPTDDIQKTLNAVNSNLNTNDIFLKQSLNQVKTALEQLKKLSNKYHCVVDNPPYMGGGNMNKPLADFVKTNYPASKADLMACFMEAGLAVLQEKGYLGMINQHSWMFLSSYENLREKLIKETHIDTLLHLGARTFPEIGGEVVQNAAFSLVNTESKKEGSYIRLVDEKHTDLKKDKTIEAIQNPDCTWFYKANQKDFKKIAANNLAYWLSEDAKKLFDGLTLRDNYELKQGLATGDNNRFLRFWSEIVISDFIKNSKGHNQKFKWYPYNKGGETRRWYGNQEYVVNWANEGNEIKNNFNYSGKLRSRPQNINYYFKESLTWSLLANGSFAVRKQPEGAIFDINGMSLFVNDEKEIDTLQAVLASKVGYYLLQAINPTLAFQLGNVSNFPILKIDDKLTLPINEIVRNQNFISKKEWDSRETSWDFQKNELTKHQADTLEESYDLYQNYWKNKFFQLHKNEEELNKQFIDIYGLQEELTPEVPLEDITILKEETDIVNGELVFDAKEVLIQFISYAVGCMFGRYSLDKEGLIIANQGETLEDYLKAVGSSAVETSFMPDDDNIIPILDDEWFEDDIVGRFYEFLKATFGAANFDKNLAFVEDSIGKDIRKFFVKDFYNDHIKRYKKRPIYWMFSSPKGAFNVLIYMHRYTPDTLNQILNGYLVEYREKLNTRMEHLDHLIESGNSSEQTRAAKEKDKLKLVLIELQEYEREVLYPLATERIAIDLDDGVLVNYNKFGNAIKEVKGLNDKKAKEKVMKFDWIDTTTIK